MEHLRIVFLVLNLMAGTGIFLHVLWARRTTGERLLKPLLFSVVFLNLMAVGDLVYEYTLTNLFDRQLGAIPHALLYVTYYAVFGAEFGLVISLAKVAAGLRERRWSGRLSILLAAWGAFFAAATLGGLTVFLRTADMEWIYLIHGIWTFTLLAWIFGLLFGIDRGAAPGSSRRCFVHVFGVGWGLFALGELNFYFIKLPLADFDPLILLAVNLCPLVWLRRSYLPEWRRTRATADVAAPLATFCARHGLSGRESQIVAEVLAGKSNKEIEDVLFISVSTVKNHLSSIYRKTGVGSRAQLIVRFNEGRKS